MSDEPKVSEEHPELHHYTDWGGLEGIFTSQTLWATHFSQLNDYTEITHLEDVLANAVAEKLVAYANLRCLTEPDFRESMSELGDIREAAIHDAGGLVGSLYDVTFRGRIKNDKNWMPPFVEPYLTSFCSHSQDSVYEAANGLLSQWNRYGGDEAFAIVFDTGSLEILLAQEKDFYGNYFFGFFDVIYNDEDLNFTDRFSTEIEKVFGLVRDFIFDKAKANAFPVFEDLVRTASRFKHRAFKEEREVRIVVCPATIELEDYIKKEHPDLYEERDDKLKTIHSEPKEHICLFESDVSKALPIKRIHKIQAIP